MSNNVNISTQTVGSVSIMPAVTSLAKSPGSSSLDDVTRAEGVRCIDAQRSVHSQYVLQLLQLQRRAGFLCDITIHVRDRSFKAHKPLLAACSLYFRSLFADASMKDSTALDLNILTPDGFEVLLDYIYSGSLSITADNSTEVLSAATCLQMTNVVETCLSFMRSSFRMSKPTDPPTTPNGPDANNWPIGNSLHSSGTPNFILHSMGNPHMPPHSMDNPLLTPPSMSNSHLNPNFASTPATSQSVGNSLLSPISVGNPVPHSVGISHLPPHTPRTHGASPHRYAKSQTEASKLPKPITPQDNLQIVSAGSINEDEFKTMIGTSTHSNICSQPNGVVDDSLPSTSQLQSVLPLLVTKQARQPTIKEVQHQLANLTPQSSGAESIPRQPPGAPNPTYLPPGALQAHSVKWEIHRDVPHDVTSSGKTTVLPPHQVQAAIEKPPFPTSLQHCQGATDRPNFVPKVLTTISSSADKSRRHAPELYSGEFPRTAPGPRVVTSDVVVSYSSEVVISDAEDDGDNHLEISDDEGSDCEEWRAKRPAPKQTDLSGTPCRTAAVHVASSRHGDAANALTSPLQVVMTSQDAKSSSLPASPSLKMPRKWRANSCGTLANNDENDVISYELASSAVEAFQASSELSQAAIVTKAIHTSLIPPKSAIVTSQPPQQAATPTDLQPIKIELPSDEELSAHPGVFPQSELRETDISDDFGSPVTSGSFFGSPSNHHKNQTPSSSSVAKSDEESSSDLALDLSMATQARRRGESYESVAGSGVGEGAEFDVEALNLLHQEQQRVDDAGSNKGKTESASYNGVDADMSLRLGAFSRKPRRTTGGQTCTWPGCGRLFRHKNIFEEHQKLHELGIPVSQLRKCYMGARVKKTVREQLEEMRTNDQGDDIKGRGRKRKQPIQDSARKRVTVKDRLGTFHTPQSSTVVPQMTYSQFQPHPVPRFLSYRGPPPPPRPPNVVQSTSFIDNLAHATPPRFTASPRLVSPVEQTLALLGIPTPIRRGENNGGVGNSPAAMSDMTLDQFRRRLALREASGSSQTMMYGTSVAAPHSGHSTGTVAGVLGPHQARFQVPLGSISAIGSARAPRPVDYPGSSLASDQGAKCS